MIECARIVDQASEEIAEIEEAIKRLRELREDVERYLKYIQEGRIHLQTQGEFEWHEPVQNTVTITTVDRGVRSIVRDMTPDEILKYPQQEISFENGEEVTSIFDPIDDAAATILDQIDYENYDPGTFVPLDDEPKSKVSIPITEEEKWKMVRVWAKHRIYENLVYNSLGYFKKSMETYLFLNPKTQCWEEWSEELEKELMR